MSSLESTVNPLALHPRVSGECRASTPDKSQKGDPGLRGPHRGSLHRWEGGTTSLRPPVFTCDVTGLLFLCQFWSIINHRGDPLAGDPVPTETSLFRHIVNEYLLMPGTWLGGHSPGKVQSQESCPVLQQGPVSPRRLLKARITKGSWGKLPPGTCVILKFELFKLQHL